MKKFVFLLIPCILCLMLCACAPKLITDDPAYQKAEELLESGELRKSRAELANVHKRFDPEEEGSELWQFLAYLEARIALPDTVGLEGFQTLSEQFAKISGYRDADAYGSILAYYLDDTPADPAQIVSAETFSPEIAQQITAGLQNESSLDFILRKQFLISAYQSASGSTDWSMVTATLDNDTYLDESGLAAAKQLPAGTGKKAVLLVLNHKDEMKNWGSDTPLESIVSWEPDRQDSLPNALRAAQISDVSYLFVLNFHYEFEAYYYSGTTQAGRAYQPYGVLDVYSTGPDAELCYESNSVYGAKAPQSSSSSTNWGSLPDMTEVFSDAAGAIDFANAFDVDNRKIDEDNEELEYLLDFYREAGYEVSFADDTVTIAEPNYYSWCDRDYFADSVAADEALHTEWEYELINAMDFTAQLHELFDGSCEYVILDCSGQALLYVRDGEVLEDYGGLDIS